MILVPILFVHVIFCVFCYFALKLLDNWMYSVPSFYAWQCLALCHCHQLLLVVLINHSKHICIAPYVAKKSEAHNGEDWAKCIHLQYAMSKSSVFK